MVHYCGDRLPPRKSVVRGYFAVHLVAGRLNRRPAPEPCVFTVPGNLSYTHYRPHPKDGGGNVFSLFTTGGCTRVMFPVPSPDSGPRSFPGGTLVSGPMSLPILWSQVLSRRFPSLFVLCPFWGIPQSCHRSCQWGTPVLSQVLLGSTPGQGVPSSHHWGTPWPGLGYPPARTGVPPLPARTGVSSRDRLCCGWYAFSQEDFLVYIKKRNLLSDLSLWTVLY